MWKIDEFVDELRRAGLSDRTIASYRLHAGRFITWCTAEGAVSPKHLTQDTVLRYVQTEISTRSYTTGWKYVAAIALRRYFAILESCGDIFIAPAVPVRRPRVFSDHYRAVERETLASILDSFSTHSHPDLLAKTIMETAYSAALRPGEIRHLEIEDIDFANGRLFVTQSKGKKDRIVPIGQTACFWLRRYITEVRPLYASDTTERHVFLGIRSRKPFHHRAIAEFIRYRLKKHGYPVFSLHQLRASAATHLVEAGVDTALVQRILGHADINTTRSYVQIEARELASKLAASHPRIALALQRRTSA